MDRFSGGSDRGGAPAASEASTSDGRYRGGLVVFAVIEILAAIALGGLAVIFTLAPGFLGALASRLEGNAEAIAVTRSVRLATGLLYGGLGVFFASVGVGSLYPRRWVRPLVIYAATLWLLAGVPVFLASIALVPSLWGSPGSLGGDEDASGAFLSLFVGVVIYAVLFTIYVALPAAFFWFHRRRGLKDALERLDPVPRWTDRCPAPVLSLAFSLGISSLLCAPFVAGPVTLFGWTLTGAAAACVILPGAVALAALAVATYRLSPAGWWGSLTAVVIFTIVSVDMSFRVDLAAFTEGLSMTSLEPREPSSAAASASAPWLLAAGSLLFGFVCLVAVLRLRRFFDSSSASPK
jgi:hypothetical protein